MADQSKGRPVDGTETSWCRAVPGGTGVTVLAIRASKPQDILCLHTALEKIQNSHPILNSRLHANTKTNTFSFVTSPTPYVKIKSYNLPSTLEILETLSNSSNQSVSPYHLILEHELNQNSWQIENITTSTAVHDMFFASIYTMAAEWVVVLRLHVSACDRTTAVSLLRELVGLMGGGGSDGGGVNKEIGNKGEVNLGIEDLIPSGKAKKSMWVRGVDRLSYSVNSLRHSNLKFRDTKSARVSEVVRLQMNQEETQGILNGCKARGIKLCAAVVAAGLMAADKYSKNRLDQHQKKKYGIVTLTDCRSSFDPPLSDHHFGSYHSAVLNTHHTTTGGETLWDLATKTYKAFASSKNSNKHFTDMADLNFLMCKAIDNPSLTSSSSMRTCLMSVFEDPVVDDSNDMQREMGLEEYIGCASVHGIGPSIAIFDTIRDGRLDCVCVYPSPLHSREQMQELVDKMKKILVDCDN